MVITVFEESDSRTQSGIFPKLDKPPAISQAPTSFRKDSNNACFQGDCENFLVGWSKKKRTNEKRNGSSLAAVYSVQAFFPVTGLAQQSSITGGRWRSHTMQIGLRRPFHVHTATSEFEKIEKCDQFLQNVWIVQTKFSPHLFSSSFLSFPFSLALLLLTSHIVR